jgi:hypothetical protein
VEIKYSLLENGFDFLVCAINNINIAREDSTEEIYRKRLMKYAILHLASGIELVFKHRLLKEHWTYIFADMNKSNKHAFEIGDFKSVDSTNNIERLKNLCNVTFTKGEEETLETLRKKRNKIEHFKIEDSLQSVEAIMTKSLSLILNFIAIHTDIGLLSSDERELLEQIKKETLELEEVIAAREEVIRQSAEKDGVLEKLIKCPECLEDYFLIGDCENECLFCYYTDTPQNAADEYISNVLRISHYECVKDGGEYPLYECSECDENSMVYDQESQIFICFNCGSTIDSSDVDWCSDCGRPFCSLEEDVTSLCNDCIDYRFNKDD